MIEISALGVKFDKYGEAEVEGFYIRNEPYLHRVRLGLRRNFDRWSNSTDFVIYNGRIPQVRNEAEFRAVLRKAKEFCNPGWGEEQDFGKLCRSAVKQFRRERHRLFQLEKGTG